jgi:hypothetical protein
LKCLELDPSAAWLRQDHLPSTTALVRPTSTRIQWAWGCAGLVQNLVDLIKVVIKAGSKACIE